MNESHDTPPGLPDGRRHELASTLDARLAELWAELFAIPQENWDHDLIGWFLRAAYGQGYCDSLREAEPGALCRELGYRIPAPTS